MIVQFIIILYLYFWHNLHYYCPPFFFFLHITDTLNSTLLPAEYMNTFRKKQVRLFLFICFLFLCGQYMWAVSTEMGNIESKSEDLQDHHVSSHFSKPTQILPIPILVPNFTENFHWKSVEPRRLKLGHCGGVRIKKICASLNTQHLCHRIRFSLHGTMYPNYINNILIQCVHKT